MFNLIFNKNFSEDFKKRATRLFSKAEGIFSKYLKFNKQVDIYFSDISPDDSVSEELRKSKITGYAMTGHQVVFFEVWREDFTDDAFLMSVFHELNHESRGQNMQILSNIWGDTILEGLAINFERQINQEFNIERNFLEKIDEKKLRWGLKRILKIYKNNEEYDHNEWYFNLEPNKKSDLPTNFIYRIGDFLVSEYCEKYNILPSEALSVSNEEFEMFAREEILCED